jgi:hypothetical protein
VALGSGARRQPRVAAAIVCSWQLDPVVFWRLSRSAGKHTMLGADAAGKFVGVAIAGRWTPSSRFASRDAVVARVCSRCAGRASAATATATSRVGSLMKAFDQIVRQHEIFRALFGLI